MINIIFIFVCLIVQTSLLPVRNISVETVADEILQNEPQKYSVLINIMKDSEVVEEESSVSLSRPKRHNGRRKTKYHWPNATVPIQIDHTVISEFLSLEFKEKVLTKSENV